MIRLLKYSILIYCIGLWPSSVLANDNLQISGFGSIVAAQVVDGSGYVAEYPNLGIYDEKLDFSQETRLGIQSTATITDDLTATLQVISRANNNYDPEVEWLFANYALNDSIDIQAGKLRVPVYYFSEYMDVGYAYPWIRVPSDAYSLDVTSFDGIQLNYRTYFGNIDVTTTLFSGRNQANEDEDGELMSYLFGGSVRRTFDDFVGGGLEFSTDDTTLKITYSQADMTQNRSGAFNAADNGTTKESISFIDLYFKQSLGSFALMLEYNKYDPFYSSYFISGTYQVGQVTYYLINSKFELDDKINGVPIEEHDTNSIGFRYDFKPRVAFKADISMINDTGVFAVNHDANNDGDAIIISTGIDFIF